jgi:hypothetical protein
MKYIKKFESHHSETDLEEFNIDRRDILYYFTDILDEGFDVRVNVVSKLIDLKDTSVATGFIKFAKINYITVDIVKGSKEIIELKEKYLDLFKDTIEVANDRLNDIGLFIKDYIMFGNRITILIYKKQDEKYIK